MSFEYKTSKSIIVDSSSFFIGTTGFNTTTTPSNENKITASDGDLNDNFGFSVASGSNRIVVGSISDDDNGSNSGSAYIFDLNGTQLAKITASDGFDNDRFGVSVATGSNRIVVGADQDDDAGTNSGSAYIFNLDGTQLAKITASDAAGGDRFGTSVAVGCGRIVVGAYAHNISAGAAYIYDLDGNQLAKITASDAASSDQFGYSVAVGSGRIVVGAYADDDNGSASGSAYIFDLDGNQLVKITASDGAAFDNFGNSVAIGSGRIVVSSPYDSDNGSFSGSAYIYDLDGNNEIKITASDGTTGDSFGWSVAVGSGRIVIGAYGVNSSTGAAYVYDLDGTQLAKITASDGAASDFFGKSVSIGSGRIIVGSEGHDVGINTNQGAAYIYETPYQVHYLDQLDKR